MEEHNKFTPDKCLFQEKKGLEKKSKQESGEIKEMRYSGESGIKIHVIFFLTSVFVLFYF